jgi:hypothetical protein
MEEEMNEGVWRMFGRNRSGTHTQVPVTAPSDLYGENSMEKLCAQWTWNTSLSSSPLAKVDDG